MTRAAKPEELSAVRAIMEETYHDSDAFNDYFFSYFVRPETTFICEEDQKPVAAMMGLPIRMRYLNETHSVVLSYGGAVDAAYHKRGLLKQAILYSLDIARERGETLTVANINLSASKPWQSIGFEPAFPIHLRREERAEARPLNARAAELKDCWVVRHLDAIYERKFSDYAHPARDEQDWLHVLCEYSLGDGGVMLMWEQNVPVGYLVYEPRGDELLIKECACEDPEMEAALRQYALDALGFAVAVCYEPCTPENQNQCVPYGVKMRLAPGGLPDFPYEKSYLNLLHT